MDKPVSVFAGKGGVGKTTCAAAAALHSASQGHKTLIISTDATPSLAHIFEIQPKAMPARITENLYLNELSMAEVTRMWNDKFGQDVYQVFSVFIDIDYVEFVDFMVSILPGLAEEFMVDHIREISRSQDYEAIIWDTAPLGQTLTLLKTPEILSQHLKLAPRIYSRLKAGQATKESILTIIKRWEALSALNMDFLRNSVDFNIVAIPEALSVYQLEGILNELTRYKFVVSRLIVNNVVMLVDSNFMNLRAVQQQFYLRLIYDKYNNLQITELPMFAREIKGLNMVEQVIRFLYTR